VSFAVGIGFAYPVMNVATARTVVDSSQEPGKVHNQEHHESNEADPNWQHGTVGRIAQLVDINRWAATSRLLAFRRRAVHAVVLAASIKFERYPITRRFFDEDRLTTAEPTP
jgi:hypothetical protein